MEQTIEVLPTIREWSMDRIHQLADGDIESQFNAVAIAEEFHEWINIPHDQDNISYLALQNEEWTEDKEIDTL